VISLLERLTNCDGVEAGSQDMSSPFREAVQLCLPHARIVADHFHVIQHVGKAVNKVIGRWAKKEQGKKALDGQRHRFLRNDVWIATVKRDGPTELRKALSAFRNWRQEMLAFFDFLPAHLSNGPVEGHIKRLKLIKRSMYGRAQFDLLRQRVLQPS
jgi:transposase